MEKEYLIKKWLLDELNPEEMEAFEAMEDASLSRAILENASNFKASNFSKVASYQELEDKLTISTPVRKLSWKRNLLRIASVLVIGFAVYYGFFYNPLTNIGTMAAEKTTFLLPDNSTVILNASSEISFNKKNWNDNRLLELNGEAFFKVAKGKKFDVKTSEGIVTVLGTEFNVKQRDGYFEVICYEGVVQITAASIQKKLMAGDSFRIDNGIEYNNTTENDSPQWTQNMSTFSSVRYIHVLQELERQYSLTISYEGEKKTQFFTGAFTHNNVENALQSITTPLGLKYQFKGSNNVIVSD